jgi:hypothetical protein
MIHRFPLKLRTIKPKYKRKFNADNNTETHQFMNEQSSAKREVLKKNRPQLVEIDLPKIAHLVDAMIVLKSQLVEIDPLKNAQIVVGVMNQRNAILLVEERSLQ